MIAFKIPSLSRIAHTKNSPDKLKHRHAHTLETLVTSNIKVAEMLTHQAQQLWRATSQCQTCLLI